LTRPDATIIHPNKAAAAARETTTPRLRKVSFLIDLFKRKKRKGIKKTKPIVLAQSL
jgi:hypothetical protein